MRLIFTLVFLAATAEAQTVSYLGLCNKTWDCSKTMQTWRNRPEIRTGWLEGSFGAACECGERILQSPKRKILRLHLANGPCLRNRRCGPQEVFAGYTVKGADRAIRARPGRILARLGSVAERAKKRLALANGEMTCYVSPTLESDFSEKARGILLEFTRSRFPECGIVDNPLRKPCKSGFICEKHGSAPALSAPCIADLDGEDGREVDLEAYRKNTRRCFLRYYWEPWMNCLREGRFIDPLSRDCRFGLFRFFQARKQCQLL